MHTTKKSRREKQNVIEHSPIIIQTDPLEHKRQDVKL